jgi:hypothetical protein
MTNVWMPQLAVHQSTSGSPLPTIQALGQNAAFSLACGPPCRPLLWSEGLLLPLAELRSSCTVLHQGSLGEWPTGAALPHCPVAMPIRLAAGEPVSSLRCPPPTPAGPAPSPLPSPVNRVSDFLPPRVFCGARGSVVSTPGAQPGGCPGGGFGRLHCDAQLGASVTCASWCILAQLFGMGKTTMGEKLAQGLNAVVGPGGRLAYHR